MGDAVKAMIKWCNDQGGINGRQIVGDYYDAAVLQVNTVMQQACKTDFMLVGEGFALDEAAEQTRLGCNLAAVPGLHRRARVRQRPEMYQAVAEPGQPPARCPSPTDGQALPAGHLQLRLPAHHAWPRPPSTASTRSSQAVTTAGWNILANCTVMLNYNGEPDYKPFVQKLQSCGAQDRSSINATPGPTLLRHSSRP